MFSVFPCSHDVISECDSPFTLTNHTLDFIDKKWSSEIDFVVCEFPHSFSRFYSLLFSPSTCHSVSLFTLASTLFSFTWIQWIRQTHEFSWLNLIIYLGTGDSARSAFGCIPMFKTCGVLASSDTPRYNGTDMTTTVSCLGQPRRFTSWIEPWLGKWRTSS